VAAPIEESHAHLPCAADDVAVGERQPVRRDDHTRPRAAAHVDAYDAGADSVDRIGDGARIGVKGGVVGDRKRRAGALSLAVGVEREG
jgi:hypothetical protein